MPETPIQLLVNGRRFGGWKRARISLSVRQLANGFDLSAVEVWPDRATALDVPELDVGDRCELLLGNERVIQGWVDQVAPGYDSVTHGFGVTGRDVTGDLVDCSAIADGGQFKGQTLEQVARRVCEPFGIPVRVIGDSGLPFKSAAIQTGETVYELLDRLARHRGLLVTSDGQGGLLIKGPGRTRLPYALVLGENIERAQAQRSHLDRYSKIRVLGSQPDDDATGGAAASEVAAEVSDAVITRYRPLVLVSEDNVDLATARRRAEWERSTRAGRALQITYTLCGWTHPGGLWRPDQRVPVRDPFLRVDGDLYIEAVELVLDSEGFHTDLTLTLPSAYDVLAVPEPEPLQ